MTNRYYIIIIYFGTPLSSGGVCSRLVKHELSGLTLEEASGLGCQELLVCSLAARQLGPLRW